MSNAVRSTGGHAQSLWKEGCACRPYTCGETCVSHTMVGSMLQHLLQFCNPFLPEIIPAWQSAWAVWPSRPGRPNAASHGLASSAADGSDPHPSVSTGRLHVHTPVDTPITCNAYGPCTTALCWTSGGDPRSVSVHHSHTSARRSALHTLAPASRVLTALDCPEVLVREHGGGVCLLEKTPCAYWREPRVHSLGESPMYLPGRTRVSTGEKPVCLLERNHYLTLVLERIVDSRLERRLYRRPHTTPCVCRRMPAHSGGHPPD